MKRRDFLKGLLGTAALTSTGGCKMFTGGSERIDPDLTVFISDVHVHPNSYRLRYFERIVAEILKMDPLPARVICFGDLAFLHGHAEDYAASRPALDLLSNAGISLTIGLGNHDRRGHFLEAWPEYARRTLVPGRIVTETDLGSCDLILLDTLHEPDDITKDGWITPGQFKGEQFDWLVAEAKRRTRPFLLGAHHSPLEIEDGDAKALQNLITETPNCIGWIHGHDHVWRTSLLRQANAKWGDNNFKRMLCLPSTGHWGDIGFVTFRTSEGAARADYQAIDHYFPNVDARQPIDDDLVAEKRGAFMTFRWA